jgi:hypothetical protein
MSFVTVPKTIKKKDLKNQKLELSRRRRRRRRVPGT